MLFVCAWQIGNLKKARDKQARLDGGEAGKWAAQEARDGERVTGGRPKATCTITITTACCVRAVRGPLACVWAPQLLRWRLHKLR